MGRKQVHHGICNKDDGGYLDSCDPVGCASNAFYTNDNLMCSEDKCAINTNRSFTGMIS